MFVWTIILCSYLCIANSVPHLHEKSIYKMPLGKLMCWVCMAFFVFVIVLLTLEDDTRQALLGYPACGLSRWGWAGCLLVRSGLLNCGNNRIIMLDGAMPSSF
ncbi:hypothetical protein [Escherichia coli]|uniref:hypothetical protein n=1 Tax=Escherichia coli TaxID=562 RepID=UPI0039892392